MALALGSSVCWGASDFLGGLKSRSVAVPVVLAGSYTTGLVLMAVAVVLIGESFPSAGAAAYGAAAGLAGIVGLGAFYRALAIGTMSIVAPISATGVAIPVIVGLAQGEDPSTVTSAGLALAVVGVVLASRESRPEDAPEIDEGARRQSILLALVAGAAFGTYFTFADIASEESVTWALFLSRAVSTPVLLVVVLLVVGAAAVPRTAPALAPLVLIGVLDLIANALYNVATTKGALSGVAVAAALYPVVTVLLAAAILHERVRGSQALGVVAALTGVVLIAAG
ncbi:DMT family transporter [Svornostia abyssi]|uniref:DMT family transporter n=1 Tax=Svornostia abyssi TaxID=2898438 RepID=A0ABY5PNI3_9ACTN|nr:DMT family transporter [Parviterribacteraceae bacterium J379]